MRIWIVRTAEPLPIDGENTRLWRAGIIAQTLVDHGHEVVFWSSTHDHRKKQQREQQFTSVDYAENYTIKMLYGRDYRRNISLARFRNHREMAREFAAIAPNEPKPDIILCSYPTIELAAEAVRYGKKHQVPVVLDARDMWPDIFVALAPKILRPIAQLCFWSLFRESKFCFQNAFAITGHTDEFVQWGLDRGSRQKTELDRSFPFGYSDSRPSPAMIDEANDYWERLGIREDPTSATICFFGAVSNQFVLEPVIEAVKQVNKTRKLNLVICGVGDRFNEYREATKDVEGVHFPGWVESHQIYSLMRRSTLAVAPYKDSIDFQMSIPNKAIEYFSAGLPVLTSLTRGSLVNLLNSENCGSSYGGDATRLCSMIEELLDRPQQTREMSHNAQRLFNANYRADAVYGAMSKYLENTAGTFKSLLTSNSQDHSNKEIYDQAHV